MQEGQSLQESLDTMTQAVISRPSAALAELTGLTTATVSNILASLAIVLVLLVLRWVVLRIIDRGTEKPGTRYQARRTATYVTFAIGLLLVGRIWFPAIHSLALFTGLATAGIAIALRDPIVNLAGWAFILWRRPFVVGDRVQLLGHSGDVVDLRLFQFTILEIGNWVDADQSTGRIIHVPNGKVFTEPVANYARGFRYIWHEVPVLITFESDWRKAKRILLDIAEENAEHLSDDAQQRLRAASSRYMIFYTTLTPIVYTTVRDSGVLLTLRFLCDPRRRRSSEEAMWEAILTEFARHEDVDFAYPTTRFYDNMREGKTGTRPGSPGHADRPPDLPGPA
ncbi:MAG TPA: mechanosensitive ion channel family protein [Longimicrobiales bacterium]|nr:mechanosensitive ion channel family protein [Longimicrobiales bacterium]